MVIAELSDVLKGVKTLVRDRTTRARIFLEASAGDPFL
jgi:hypothetical protein